jgi:hypothetical protein
MLQLPPTVILFWSVAAQSQHSIASPTIVEPQVQHREEPLEIQLRGIWWGSYTKRSGLLVDVNITAPDAGNECGWTDIDDVVAAMESGNAYVNVHTTAESGGVPSGEAWGNLLPDEANDDDHDDWRFMLRSGLAIERFSRDGQAKSFPFSSNRDRLTERRSLTFLNLHVKESQPWFLRQPHNGFRQESKPARFQLMTLYGWGITNCHADRL